MTSGIANYQGPKKNGTRNVPPASLSISPLPHPTIDSVFLCGTFVLRLA